MFKIETYLFCGMGEQFLVDHGVYHAGELYHLHKEIYVLLRNGEHVCDIDILVVFAEVGDHCSLHLFKLIYNDFGVLIKYLKFIAKDIRMHHAHIQIAFLICIC